MSDWSGASTNQTPRSRGGGGSRGRGRDRGGPRGDNGKPPGERGLFLNGMWHCDCNPRLPAEHFRVKKESKNQGRWFYTCQKAQSQAGRCDFFLWDEDAAPRMEAAVLNNSNSEPRSVLAKFDTAMGGVEETQNPISPSKTTNRNSPKMTGKRRLPWVGSDEEDTADEEEAFPWPLTGEEKKALTEMTDEVAERSAPITPMKMVKHGEGDAARVARCNGLITPNTTPRKPEFSFQMEEAAATPTPLRFTDKFGRPVTPASNGEQGLDLTTSISSFLKEANVLQGEGVSKELHILLDRHGKRIQGIIRGRDAARQALSSHKATIVNQAQRISVLETELESTKALVRYLRETLGEQKKTPRT